MEKRRRGRPKKDNNFDTHITVLGYTSVVVKKYRKFQFKTDFTDTKTTIN